MEVTARENESPAGSSRTSRAKSRTTSDTPEQTAPQTDSSAAFDPREHTQAVRDREFLPLRWRLKWLRAVHPQAMIQTDLVSHDIAAGTAVVRASVRLPGGGEASGYGWGERNADSSLDYLTDAENKALARALAAVGFGSEYSFEFDEANAAQKDAPIVEATANPAPRAQESIPAPVAETSRFSRQEPPPLIAEAPPVVNNRMSTPTPATVAEVSRSSNGRVSAPVPIVTPAPVVVDEDEDADDSVEDTAETEVVVDAAQLRDAAQEEVPPFLRSRPASIVPPSTVETEDDEGEEDTGKPTPTMDDIRRLMPTANNFFTNRDRASNAAANVRSRERTVGYTPADEDAAAPTPIRENAPAPRIAPLPPLQTPRQPDSSDIDTLLRPVTDQRLRMILRQIYTAARTKNIAFDKVRIRAEKVYGVPLEDLNYEEAEEYRDYIQNYKSPSGGGQQGS